MNQPNLFGLTNRVAIITGGGGLLASEHAIALHAYGAKIILADVNLESCNTAIKKLEAEGVTATAKHCDVTSKESWQKLLDEVVNEFGSIDILINNAGLPRRTAMQY